MRKILGSLSTVVLLAGCATTGISQPALEQVNSPIPSPTASEVRFCQWWVVWWPFPDEDAFRLSDERLSTEAFERSLEVVRAQPLDSGIGIDWFDLTGRYGRAMLAVSERAYIRSNSGWGTVLDQVRDSYEPINTACVDVNFYDQLPRQ